MSPGPLRALFGLYHITGSSGTVSYHIINIMFFLDIQVSFLFTYLGLCRMLAIVDSDTDNISLIGHWGKKL